MSDNPRHRLPTLGSQSKEMDIGPFQFRQQKVQRNGTLGDYVPIQP